MEKKLLRSRRRPSAACWVYALGAAALLLCFLRRLPLGLATMDEAFNLSEGYRIVQGQIPLVDIWGFFQTGDSLMAPFLFLYRRLTGSSEGIVLFSRLVFFALNLALAALLYGLLHQYTGRFPALAAGAVIVTHTVYCCYYLWYDTALLLFMLAGLLCLLSAALSGKRRASWLAALAGVFHAVMVYAYPTALLVYVWICLILLACRLGSGTLVPRSGKLLLCYIGGTASVFGLFLLFCLLAGKNALFFLDSDFLDYAFRNRFRSGEHGYFLTAIYFVYVALCEGLGIVPALPRLLLLLAALGLTFLAGWRQRQREKGGAPLSPWLRAGLLLLIPVSAYAFNLFFSTHGVMVADFYLALFTPLLVWLFPRESRERLLGLRILLLLWLPCAAAYLAIGFTAIGGNLKSTVGFYPGCIGTFLLLLLHARLLSREPDAPAALRSRGLAVLLSLLLPAAQVAAYWQTSYMYAEPEDCTTKVTEGVFAGLWGDGEAEKYPALEQLVKSCVRESDRSLFCADVTPYVYLFTDLENASVMGYEQPMKGGDWDRLLSYWEKVSGQPDIIVVEESHFASRPEAMHRLLAEEYELEGRSGGFGVYHRRAQ